MTQQVRITIDAEVDVVNGKLEIQQIIERLLRLQNTIDLIKMKVEEEKDIYKTEPRFDWMFLDEETNIPDLKRWVDENVLAGLIDEEKGGIIGYIHHEHIDEITKLLNK